MFITYDGILLAHSETISQLVQPRDEVFPAGEQGNVVCVETFVDPLLRDGFVKVFSFGGQDYVRSLGSVERVEEIGILAVEPGCVEGGHD